MIKVKYSNSINTKKRIIEAYLSMSKDESNKLSVTDIVKKLKINRGTFYLHFNSIGNIDDYIIDKLNNSFKSIEQDFRLSEIDKSPEVILNKLTDILSYNYKFFTSLVQSKYCKIFQDKIKLSLINSISNNFRVMKYVMNYENFKLVTNYIVSGIISTYTEWLKGILHCSSYDLSILLGKVIRLGLKGCIAYGN